MFEDKNPYEDRTKLWYEYELGKAREHVRSLLQDNTDKTITKKAQKWLKRLDARASE
jgi:cobalamin-dependent methionine synthase I